MPPNGEALDELAPNGVTSVDAVPKIEVLGTAVCGVDPKVCKAGAVWEADPTAGPGIIAVEVEVL